MSRSGLSESDGWDDDNWAVMYRGHVASATRGKRGQRFYKELLAALDAMPKQELYAEVFDSSADGSVCALGALARAKGIDVKDADPEDSEIASDLAIALDVHSCLTREVIWQNDENYRYQSIRLEHTKLHGEHYAELLESPYDRWCRMRKWVAAQIKGPTP